MRDRDAEKVLSDGRVRESAFASGYNTKDLEYYASQRLTAYDQPLLFLTAGHKAMFKRMKRRYKRLAKGRKEEEGQREESQLEPETFLRTIKTEDISERITPQLSMDSDIHDIY